MRDKIKGWDEQCSNTLQWSYSSAKSIINFSWITAFLAYMKWNGSLYSQGSVILPLPPPKKTQKNLGFFAPLCNETSMYQNIFVWLVACAYHRVDSDSWWPRVGRPTISTAKAVQQLRFEEQKLNLIRQGHIQTYSATSGRVPVPYFQVWLVFFPWLFGAFVLEERARR